MRLHVQASDRSGEQLRVIVYSNLITRTGFDEALSGHIHGYAIYSTNLSLDSLPADTAGGVDVDIPVNESSAGLLPALYYSSGSAVFPVQVGLYDDSGVAHGEPLTTFLVYGQPPSMSGLPKLSVSLTLPVHARPAVSQHGELGGLPAGQSVGLDDLVDVLAAHPGVRLSLAVTPQTIDSLEAGAASDVNRSTLANLSRLVRAGNIQVVPETYVSVPLRGWADAGLQSELADQLNSGASVLTAAFGATPSASTWVVNGPLTIRP